MSEEQQPTEWELKLRELQKQHPTKQPGEIAQMAQVQYPGLWERAKSQGYKNIRKG